MQPTPQGVGTKRKKRQPQRGKEEFSLARVKLLTRLPSAFPAFGDALWDFSGLYTSVPNSVYRLPQRSTFA
jgi:hypothetical protein